MARLTTRIEYPGGEEPLPAANLNCAQPRTLSDPEIEVLLLLRSGQGNAEIAAGIGRDPAAVKDHIKSILRKAIGYGKQGKQLSEPEVVRMALGN
jgi:DNA-binding CsgD family transcriptional regulator